MYEWNFLWKNGKEEGKLKGKLYLRIFFYKKGPHNRQLRKGSRMISYKKAFINQELNK